MAKDEEVLDNCLLQIFNKIFKQIPTVNIMGVSELELETLQIISLTILIFINWNITYWLKNVAIRLKANFKPIND
jgi:hypothetical protein